MRGFLGVTAHYMDMGRNGGSLKSVLLSCDHFTGERISEKFEQICENYSIKKKLDDIICDNASNMRKAFTVCFPATTSNEAEDVDDSNLWEEIEPDAVADIESSCRQQQQHLQCFSHTLKLVIRDGRKETNTLSSQMSKVTKFCSLLHSTCGLKEAFEEQLGAKRSIPSAVATRWNS
ncbi:hypothetical protein N1851_014001 [Merluccius polli]|uniref:Uncharacterized protein n=1 Tax=Merluccius polli TaxID=89951 RepID=A0AA47P4R6_MERPO|nr:hypothetical protein N1851_014001 [Merluccius polli]